MVCGNSIFYLLKGDHRTLSGLPRAEALNPPATTTADRSEVSSDLRVSQKPGRHSMKHWCIYKSSYKTKDLTW